ncbi:unnamed protein product [Rotaria sordida]|uniref:AAA+ ATPase domain-containing protein n=2 Tax=Rotaria sordida TaxID=392033 RepID=A0A818REX3_9BILA|nr:unnamed protein product [Rotaria sordida]CAF3630695.1 unnamed protein product [Rotaria sordida]CAF3655795.1 unnamed protein product [Rotaria sordida]
MDNEATTVINNGDNTDTNLPANIPTDNGSRRSSRVGSARSGRSKAASVREAPAVDGSNERKTSANGVTSPKPDVITNGDRQHSAVVNSKPASPIVPIVDTPSGEFDDDNMNQEDGHVKSEIESIFEYIHKLVTLPGLDEKMWTDGIHERIRDYLNDPDNRIMCFYIDRVLGLCVDFGVPTNPFTHLVFFIKNQAIRIFEKEQFIHEVQYGNFGGKHFSSLLRLMSGLYAPLFFGNKMWPDSIKNDFASQLHRFLATLTDIRWRMEGITKLYIPKEGLDIPIEQAAKDKELVQRLESAMVHWCRQLKDVSHSQDASIVDENSGPLEEIEFWKARSQDLLGISQQLDQQSIKQITQILKIAKSSYLSQFLKLADQLQSNTKRADNNLTFLLALKDPCHELADAKPNEIPRILPKLISLIRVIWINSEFYNRSEMLTALFRKLSNEVIRRCTAAIDLDKIFDGNIISSQKTLNECIECCQQWQEIYNNAQSLHEKFSLKGWRLDKTTIFAQIEAFIQRCRDLLDLCECQMHFARWEEGVRTELPIFGGQRGPSINRMLTEIETAFDKNLQELRKVQHTILNVKATTWHEDYNRFRSAIKDLEVMMTNVITYAFDAVKTVEQGVEALDVFTHLNSREAIRRTLDKKTVDLYNIFKYVLQTIQSIISTSSIPQSLDRFHPHYAGSAFWARNLKRRIERMMSFLNMAHFLPNVGISTNIRQQYEYVKQALDDFIQRQFKEWSYHIENEPTKKLECPLIKRINDEGYLQANFDPSLIKLFQEIKFWERLGFDIPPYATEILSRKNELRTARENVMLIVRDYNRILDKLEPNERILFKERLKVLDKKLAPGLNKITWLKPTHEYTIECRIHASELQQQVDKFKQSYLDCIKLCKKISETLLVKIDTRKIFENLEFEEYQKQHRKIASEKIREYFNEILSKIHETHKIFENDPPDVQHEWNRIISELDKWLERAIRYNFKASLTELSKAINGDGKAAPGPLFKIEIILEPKTVGDTTLSRINFKPDLATLKAIINNIGEHELADSITFLRRLRPRTNEEPLHMLLNKDEAKQHLKHQIAIGLDANEKHLDDYQTTWNGVRELWDVDKERFIARYEERCPDASFFDADINRYTEVANNVQSRDTFATVQFVLIDCSPLKNALVVHCLQWQAKLTALLLKLATNGLEQLANYIEENSASVLMTPENHYGLEAKQKLLETLQQDIPIYEAKFAPLQEQFALLEKYEKPVPSSTRDMLAQLDERWQHYLQCLTESEEMLKKLREKFKSKLLQQSEDFKKSVSELVSDFKTNGPFTSSTTPEEALNQIDAMKQRLTKLKEEEQELRRGLGIFRIDHPLSKDIQNLEKDIEALEGIWTMAHEWNQMFDKWKLTTFGNLQTQVMEDYAQAQYKKLHKLSKDFREKNWEIIDSTKSRVDQFRRTMPLMKDLHNKDMRDRHWRRIKDDSQKEFDESSEDFTLEAIINMHFEENAQLINEVSEAAQKEAQIERGIEKVKEQWDKVEFEIIPFKDKGHYKIKSTEEINKTIEEHQVSLSTFKASRFIKPFAKEVDKWERDISHVLEVTELWLTVQRQWLYLENIFYGEDIRRQLAKETALFDEVNEKWKSVMTTLNQSPNAFHATHLEGVDKELQYMNLNLEEIQKSLEMYLENKRRQFPRFYFISNDDLLEILGQSKNPPGVMPHMKKLFDNIKTLTLVKTTSNAPMAATEMRSNEDEVVPFDGQVLLDGQVEKWLRDVENKMKEVVKRKVFACRHDLSNCGTKREKWLKSHPGQACITASQIQWTEEVQKSLRDNVLKLRTDRKKQHLVLRNFTDMIKKNLTKLERIKLVSLVTIEIHARDVINDLIKNQIKTESSFEWQQQLRFYWRKDEIIIEQAIGRFWYGCEYLGNSGRLVITPLTDRCYMTLTIALSLCRGGSPKGPAGTGKTETVKDLGKAMAFYVIVTNCSDAIDYKSMGRMFCGYCQTGAWGCFDEFNRINIEVLSVVAQQITSILNAMTTLKSDIESAIRAKTNMSEEDAFATIDKRYLSKKFTFQGQDIDLVWSCGLFITMNPGYAGRTELPDNLKSMFRPISMVVPDSNYIAEIILFGEGFSDTRLLATKVYTLYQLCAQQLSKQDFYDFGLRSMAAVLRYAGRKKRDSPHLKDDQVVILAMKDMNVAKMTEPDLPLFNGIVSDLFPDIDTPIIDYSKFKAAIEIELAAQHLQSTNHTVTKVIQLFETKNSRHSVVLVGCTQSGKTSIWQTLKRSMTRIATQDSSDALFQRVQEYPINAKSISINELYGASDLSTGEWNDGILSNIMRTACADDKPDQKWVLFDCPIDAVWIESMNSVMDDNKILTLTNGERIAMPEQVTLLFETGDMAVASPATVSRCGIVFCDYDNLSWRPYITCWINRKSKEYHEPLTYLTNKYLKPIIQFKQQNCKELIPIAELNGVRSFSYLFDSLATKENGVDPSDEDNFSRLTELWFLFSTIWSVCASVDEDSRKKIDTFIRELEGTIPNKDSIYEYYVDPKQRAWLSWEDKLRSGWKLNSEIPFYKIIVPTVDTVRYKYIVSSLIKQGHPCLLCGPVGTGKTSVAHAVMSELDAREYSTLIINMSAQTSSNIVQEIIEARVEKRVKGVYVPIGGKKLLNFMDDFNMPAKDEYGSQPPLELLRLWLDFGFWYDRKNQTVKYIKDMLLLAGMGPPGGGRTVISPRLQSRFNLINMTFPSATEIRRIFGSMISQRLADFDDDFKSLPDALTSATIEMYETIVQKFLPTPTKIYYLFNLRDISKIFQGLLRADRKLITSKQTMIRLWIHECFRVFADRLNDDKDREQFSAILSEKLGTHMDVTFHSICQNRIPPTFGDFVNQDEIYEDLIDFDKLKIHMEKVLKDYNETPGTVPMDLVLFRDAILHITRIVRVIRQPRGNMLLIGIGGSGRQSLAKLSSFICNYGVFKIEIAKNYRRNEFREDLKRLYKLASVSNRETTFIFVDTQAVEETFFEDINNILSSGDVPNLFRPDELEEIKTSMATELKKEGVDEDNNQEVYAFLLDRVKANLHMVVCMSPVGEVFRNRIRMYPSLVNCTTIDLFADWPQDALLEVGERYLSQIELAGDEKFRLSIAQIFATVHSSVYQCSIQMWDEMRRRNYVTPSNFLELTTGYRKLLYEKRKELCDARDKLTNGLGKIEEAKIQVTEMSVELEKKRALANEAQKKCEESLGGLVNEQREVEQSKATVEKLKERVKIDEEKASTIAQAAQEDLAAAMPALEAANTALQSLTKSSITEVKSYGRPPVPVEKALEAVMILRNSEPTWAEAKRQLGDTTFINQLIDFDKDNIPDKTIMKIGKYTSDPLLSPQELLRVSVAASGLFAWVRAMEDYSKIFKTVKPKRDRYEAAMAELNEKRAQIADAERQIQEAQKRLDELRANYEKQMAEKEQLRRDCEHMQMMLEKASRLINGLASEKVRWEATVADLEQQISYVTGDCLLAAAFLSYMGPFLSQYRDHMMNEIWFKEIKKLSIPCNPSFNFANFLSIPTQVRDWNIQGLPSDTFSTENGVIVTRGTRWPLMIDPQAQAIKWIKNMEMSNNLRLIDLQTPDYLRIIEECIRSGRPCLCQNVKEELDPSLDPVLTRAVKRIGGVDILKLGDREIEYNKDFRFYMTTKLPNPHYAPEISSKANIINFAVKEQGLESQLLGIVVREEKPELEADKDKLVRGIAAGRKKLIELEDQLLRLLNETKGSLLENDELLSTLEISKQTAKTVQEQLVTSEATEKDIDAARENYRPCAERASILFFVLNDLGKIDPMYQFSLDAYIDLFNTSIKKSQKSTKLEERLNKLNEFHTYAVYKYTCRGLFEAHKLLFSFQMCVKILEAAGKINMDEYQFFLRGGIVLDRESQMDNPNPQWLADSSWDNITELAKLANFHGIIESFEQYPRDWFQWFQSGEPENTPMPGEWDSVNELQKMLIVRSLRSDRVPFCVTKFIINNLGSKFVEPPILDLSSVYEDSLPKTPIIFVLSPGVDPSANLSALAEKMDFRKNFLPLSLGQGQAPIATQNIAEGIRVGRWVFLANCHLSLSWMPDLEKIVENLSIEKVHPLFRLWLSSSPSPQFPISILQSGIKITTEPPKGIKANMKRLYALIDEQDFAEKNRQTRPEKYKRLLFCLCFFHSLLLERKKFLQLGFNINYSFNDSDFETSNLIMGNLLRDQDMTPWKAMKFIISKINYGGHVTDTRDMRVLNTYIEDLFKEEVIDPQVQYYKLTKLPNYYIPRDGSLNEYKNAVATVLPNSDNPEAFGQHTNAEVASQIREARMLFETLLSLQPQVVAVQGKKTTEEEVMEMSTRVLEQLPEKIDYQSTVKILSEDHSPLKVVLLQEIERYNLLLDIIRQSLISLQKGIKGLVVMSSDLEEIFRCILDVRVPTQWQKMYPSLKPLAAWTRDLVQRVDQLAKWAESAHAPAIFWMSGFSFPTGFLTAVMQTTARGTKISIDRLIWDFEVMKVEDNYLQTPKDGVYVKGLFLEGAGWDKKNACLIEAEPMQLEVSMPTILFRPTENKKKTLATEEDRERKTDVYSCPVYYFPNRAGGFGHPSFVVEVNLKTPHFPNNHWVKRGAALLMSLDR